MDKELRTDLGEKTITSIGEQINEVQKYIDSLLVKMTILENEIAAKKDVINKHRINSLVISKGIKRARMGSPMR